MTKEYLLRIRLNHLLFYLWYSFEYSIDIENLFDEILKLESTPIIRNIVS